MIGDPSDIQHDDDPLISCNNTHITSTPHSLFPIPCGLIVMLMTIHYYY